MLVCTQCRYCFADLETRSRQGKPARKWCDDRCRQRWRRAVRRRPRATFALGVGPTHYPFWVTQDDRDVSSNAARSPLREHAIANPISSDRLIGVIQSLRFWTELPHPFAVRRDALGCLLGLAGLRIGEVCNLTVANLCDDEPRIWVQSLKGSRPGWQFLPPCDYEALHDFVSDSPPSEFLLPTHAGEQLDTRNLRRRWNNWCRGLLGDEHRFHDLRHTMARVVHEKSGGDLIKTSRALRHKSITNTLLYVTSDEAIANLLPGS